MASPARPSTSDAAGRPRRRRLLGALTARDRFPTLVLATFVLLYANVASGALVRVSASGLGCPDWPLCNGRPVPPFAGHAVIEFSNRLVALLLIVVAALMAVSARAWHRREHPGWFWMALVVGVGTAAQAPLGAITVLLDLNPLAVMSHFLLAVVLFAVSTVLLVDVRGRADRSAQYPAWLRRVALVLAGWCLVLIASGAVVTMSGTHPGDEQVPRLWNLLDATYLHVRIAVSFVAVLALVLFAVARLTRPPRLAPRLAWLVVGITTVQIGIGEWQWRTQLPWWLVLAHVSVAAALWATVIALARVLAPAPGG